MKIPRLLAYDPLLSFADGEKGNVQKTFINSEGRPPSSRYESSVEHTSTVWREGKKTYQAIVEIIGTQPGAEELQEIYKDVREFEKQIATAFDTQGIHTHDVSGQRIESVTEILEEYTTGAVLEMFATFIQGHSISIFEDNESAPEEVRIDLWLYVCALFSLDDYIIAEFMDGRGLDEAASFFYGFLKSAELYRQTIEAAKTALSAAGRKSANARHAVTNELKARLLEEWDAQKHEYKNRADFARIVSRREKMKERTLYEWIAQHERNKRN